MIEADSALRTNLVIILVMMQVSKRVPLDDPTTLMLVRIGYLVSNLMIVGVYAFTQYKINQKKGTSFPGLPMLR